MLISSVPDDSAPRATLVTMDELAAHLRIVNATAEAALLERLIAVATAEAETFTWRTLIDRRWEDTWSGFPLGSNPLTLHRTPVRVGAIAVAYLDDDGAVQSMSDIRLVLSSPARLVPFPLSTARWPTDVSRDVSGPVTVTYTAGYGVTADEVPVPLRQAVLMMAARMYEHREDLRDGMPVAEISVGSEHLMSPYRRIEL